MINIKTLAFLTPEEIKKEFKVPLSKEEIKFLGDAICSSDWDPGLKGYMTTLNKKHQSEVIRILLEAYSPADEVSKKLIVDSAVTAVEGYWTDFEDFTDVLVENINSEAAFLILSRLVKNCSFCASFLTSMEYKKVNNQQSVDLIRQAIEKNNFIDAPDVLQSCLPECKKLLSRYD